MPAPRRVFRWVIPLWVLLVAAGTLLAVPAPAVATPAAQTATITAGCHVDDFDGGNLNYNVFHVAGGSITGNYQWSLTDDPSVEASGPFTAQATPGDTTVNFTVNGLGPWAVTVAFTWHDATGSGSFGPVQLTVPDCYLALNEPEKSSGSVVGGAATPSGLGYWEVTDQGGLTAYGDARWYGDTYGTTLNDGVVGMAATPDGLGYWLLGGDGGVFSYGDAAFYGSTGNIHLNEPAIGMASTPAGRGYWFVASDGGIFAYGDATFYGSMGGRPLNQPIVGMAVDPATGGYWLVAADGGIFSFGPGTPFFGSTGNLHLAQPIVGMEATSDGGGYRFVASDGGVFCYGDAAFSGSLGGTGIDDVVGIAPYQVTGYWILPGGYEPVAPFGGAQDQPQTGRLPT